MGKRNTKMIQITFHIPNTFITYLDKIIKKGEYRTRGDIIRCAIAQLLHKYGRISIRYMRKMCRKNVPLPKKYVKWEYGIELRDITPAPVPSEFYPYAVDVGEYYGIPFDVFERYGEPIEACYDLGGWLLYYGGSRFCAFSKSSR